MEKNKFILPKRTVRKFLICFQGKKIILYEYENFRSVPSVKVQIDICCLWGNKLLITPDSDLYVLYEEIKGVTL